jgi:ACR3 family arsenite efflux pump ArsB
MKTSNNYLSVFPIFMYAIYMFFVLNSKKISDNLKDIIGVIILVLSIGIYTKIIIDRKQRNEKIISNPGLLIFFIAICGIIAFIFCWDKI